MRDINDYFEGESGLACEFGANLSVVALEDAKRIAVDYANQFKQKWISIRTKFPDEVGQYLVRVKNKNKEGGIFLYELCTFNEEGKFEQWDTWENIIEWRDIISE